MSINQPKVIVHRGQPRLNVVVEVFAVAHDERLLIEDARQAVKELDQQGIFSYCISLDPKADEYVGDIFGRQYTVIDRIERLPERLPKLFMAPTK